MKKTALLGMLTAAALASTAGFALAQNTAQQPKAQPHEQRQNQPPAQGAALAQEQIDGKIVSLDKTKGTLSVETPQHGQLDFKLTPAQVQKLAEGEQVRVQIQLHTMGK